jgi:hypothetical protein
MAPLATPSSARASGAQISLSQPGDLRVPGAAFFYFYFFSFTKGFA